jgi:hypothetical protein
MRRFAGVLFFQFRTVRDGKSNQRRICEERTVLIEAAAPKQAVQKLTSLGKLEQYDYSASSRERIFFEFIGIRELLELGGEESENEVWWRLFEAIRPNERRSRWIPKTAELRAFSVGSERVKRRQRGRARRRAL